MEGSAAGFGGVGGLVGEFDELHLSDVVGVVACDEGREFDGGERVVGAVEDCLCAEFVDGGVEFAVLGGEQGAVLLPLGFGEFGGRFGPVGHGAVERGVLIAGDVLSHVVLPVGDVKREFPDGPGAPLGMPGGHCGADGAGAACDGGAATPGFAAWGRAEDCGCELVWVWHGGLGGGLSWVWGGRGSVGVEGIGTQSGGHGNRPCWGRAAGSFGMTLLCRRC